ncbi:MAG: MATE family efflux transporter [Butyrivibrio sp.]|nr:MATE family efflux transporter [Butyrivibrio sp.]
MNNSSKTLVKKYEIDMTSGALLGKVLIFSIPLIISSILQLLFNAADIVVVGQFTGEKGATYIAAIGSTSSLINLLVSLVMGLSVGANVLVARYYAMNDAKATEETVHTSMALSILGGIVLAVIGITLSRPLLTLMGSPDTVIEYSILYMRIYFAGMPLILIYNFGSAILRAVGDTRRPLYYLMAAGVLNVILNLIFVIGLQMNVAGVALATIISQGLSAGLIVRCLIMQNDIYRLVIKNIRISVDKLKRIVSIGLPAGIQSSLFSFSNVLIQSSVNSFGDVAMSGNATGSNLEGFVYVSMNALAQASVSFMSQNYGAKKTERLNRVLFTCVLVVTTIGLVMGNLFYIFGYNLASIYTSDSAAIEYAVNRLSIICTTYFLCGIMDVVCGALRGLGYSVMPMIVSLAGACGFRILWIMTVFQMNHTLKTLYISYPVSWFITSAVHFICYFYVKRIAVKKLEIEVKK